MPSWLAERMVRLGTAISECIIYHYGASEFLSRLSDPYWFQALGCVLGMDWHSSGITTSVVGALKRGLNPRASELGICVCGGRGRHSRRTPDELRSFAEWTNLAGESLVRTSRLTARNRHPAIVLSFGLISKPSMIYVLVPQLGASPERVLVISEAGAGRKLLELFNVAPSQHNLFRLQCCAH